MIRRLAILVVLQASVIHGRCSFWYISHCNYLLEYKEGIEDPLQGISNVMNCLARGAGYNSDFFGFGDIAAELVECRGCNGCKKVVDSRYRPGSCQPSVFRDEHWLRLEIGEFDCCPTFFETNKVQAFLIGTSNCGARSETEREEACANCSATEECPVNKPFDIDRCWDHQSRPQTLLYGKPPERIQPDVPTPEPQTNQAPSPTRMPSKDESFDPSLPSSAYSTPGPTSHPTKLRTKSPTTTQTNQPSELPTGYPSSQPKQPSFLPTESPTTASPTEPPKSVTTNQPSLLPTENSTTQQPSSGGFKQGSSQPTVEIKYRIAPGSIESQPEPKSLPVWAKGLLGSIGVMTIVVVALGIALWKQHQDRSDWFPARIF